MKPAQEDYIPYYDYYIQLVKDDAVLSALENTKVNISRFIHSIPEDKAEFAYAPDKWTIKQVLNHIIDTERIFGYRALRFARGDAQAVPPFDENIYAANAPLQTSSLALLREEFETVRKANQLLFQQLGTNQLSLKGKTAAGEVSVLAIGFMLCGHGLHHIQVIQDRYF
jgi:uncharacterized damage-inducible protein DinB